LEIPFTTADAIIEAGKGKVYDGHSEHGQRPGCTGGEATTSFVAK
jgi:hypothetical protein